MKLCKQANMKQIALIFFVRLKHNALFYRNYFSFVYSEYLIFHTETKTKKEGKKN